MSRLQTGGLALVIKGNTNDFNVGLVVKLIEYLSSEGKWIITSEDGILSVDGNVVFEAKIKSDRLIPLGDKQTQDELTKENSKVVTT